MNRTLLGGFVGLLVFAGCDTTINGELGEDSDKSDEVSDIRVGNFPGPDGPIRAPYVLVGDTAVVGGDIHWPKSSALSLGAAAGPFTRWPGGIIPYVDAGNNPHLTKGLNAWNSVSQQTGITFVRRTNQSDYINVISGDGCYSYLGMQGGSQDLSLGQGCGAAGIHELGHALGLMHEHTRADRSGYVRFNWSNIVDGEFGEFAQVNLGITQGATNYSTYDFRSIMHYRNVNLGTQYLIDPSIPLFEVVGAGPSVIDNKELSPSDISGVAAMYQGYGGQDPDDEPDPTSGCAIETCEYFSAAEGECYELGTGNYQCINTCMIKVSSCPSTGGGGGGGGVVNFLCGNGQAVPATYVCDSIVDCSDGTDESDCGTGGSDPGPYGFCNVGNESGQCIDTSITTCFGQLHTGFCPGGNEIRCCI